MIPRLALLLGFCTLACGDRTDAPPPEGDEQADSVPPVTAELPPMPSHPTARSGQMAVRAVGEFEMDRGWPARAGRCARPAMVLILAEEPGSGASVLLQLPASGQLTGAYPVKLADSAGVPEPPAAQLGFQLFEANTAEAYQAAEGEVNVSELTDRQVSGLFTVTMRHVINNRLARVAGSFQRVNVEPLPPDWCERAAAAQDSLAAADTAAAADTTERR